MASIRDASRAPAVEVPAPVASTWYTAKDLDLYPQALTPADPLYPASVADVAGEVTVLPAIDEFGLVRESSVVTAQPGPAISKSLP